MHGLRGSKRSWKDFPRLVEGDQALAEFEVAHFQYPASFRFPRLGTDVPRIQMLADGLHTEIENRYRDYASITLVCHSLGGLVARRYLADRVLELASSQESSSWTPVSKAIFYGVPNTGADLARMASRFAPWSWQLRQLSRHSDFLNDLNAIWRTLRVGDRFELQYVVAAQDGIVDRDSAESFAERREDVAVLTDCDHKSCIKPASTEDLSYRVLKNFLLRTPSRPKPSAQALRRLKVVGFDLDGTLLRGLTFSWTMIWEHLEYPQSVPRAGMKAYLNGDRTYAEWCAWAVEKFQMKGLTRSDLSELAQQIQVTKNLRPAVIRLKQAGFTTCIVSGGVDTFLHEKIPDADELFDHIFINELEFGQDGVISGVRATPYDFEGKVGALQHVSSTVDCGMEETVFVGDGFNDATASKEAGVSIAYTDIPYEHAALASHQIDQDDLMLVADAILDRP
jgi:HAD superfamily phosphoserine phosphatase-like hydrolase